MKKIIILLLIFTIIYHVTSQNSYCTINNASAIKLDGEAVVCLHILEDNIYKGKTFAFKVNVDYFQALVVSGFAQYINTLINTVTSVQVQVQFQNSLNNQTQKSEIYNKTGQRYRDIISFIILIEQGVFTQIRLDNAKCDSLGGSDICYNGQAYTPTTSNKFGTLDPRLFVSWMGSDLNKDHCISHTKRLSRYSSFSAGSIYNDAKNIVNA